LSEKTYEEGARFSKIWNHVEIGDGDLVRVKGFIASADGKEWSRARWAALRFVPVDGGSPLVENMQLPASSDEDRCAAAFL
jgi:hypothetical protein